VDIDDFDFEMVIKRIGDRITDIKTDDFDDIIVFEIQKELQGYDTPEETVAQVFQTMCDLGLIGGEFFFGDKRFKLIDIVEDFMQY